MLYLWTQESLKQIWCIFYTSIHLLIERRRKPGCDGVQSTFATTFPSLSRAGFHFREPFLSSPAFAAMPACLVEPGNGWLICYWCWLRCWCWDWCGAGGSRVAHLRPRQGRPEALEMEGFTFAVLSRGFRPTFADFHLDFGNLIDMKFFATQTDWTTFLHTILRPNWINYGILHIYTLDISSWSCKLYEYMFTFAVAFATAYFEGPFAQLSPSFRAWGFGLRAT